MKITSKQFKSLIKEYAKQAMEECGMPDENQVKIISLGEPEMHSQLFPGLGHGMTHSSDEYGGDDQGEKNMITTNLAKIADKASELRQITSQIPDNEEWVQEKIAVAASMIDAVHGYLKYTDEK